MGQRPVVQLKVVGQLGLMLAQMPVLLQKTWLALQIGTEQMPVAQLKTEQLVGMCNNGWFERKGIDRWYKEESNRRWRCNCRLNSWLELDNTGGWWRRRTS